jgi:DNA-binding transcriptional MerR regulator
MPRYTIQELASVTGISVRSLRNYLHAFPEHLHPERGSCNSLLFGDTDAEAFLRIRTLLREGHTRDDVRRLLGQGAKEATMVIRRADAPAETAGPPAVSAPADALSALVSRLDTQNDLLGRLVTENTLLRERLEVLEVRLRLREDPTTRLALPAAAPRLVPARSGALRIPVPWFLLRVKDGAVALSRAVWSAVFAPGPQVPEAPRA